MAKNNALKAKGAPYQRTLLELLANTYLTRSSSSSSAPISSGTGKKTVRTSMKYSDPPLPVVGVAVKAQPEGDTSDEVLVVNEGQTGITSVSRPPVLEKKPEPVIVNRQPVKPVESSSAWEIADVEDFDDFDDMPAEPLPPAPSSTSTSSAHSKPSDSKLKSITRPSATSSFTKKSSTIPTSFSSSSSSSSSAASSAALKSLVFPKTGSGAIACPWSDEWSQEWALNTEPKLSYGLVQHRGGPCGIIAAVQAYMLVQLLHESPVRTPNPNSFQARAALAASITDILWAAATPNVTLVELSNPKRSGESLISVMGKLSTSTYSSREATAQAVSALLAPSSGAWATPGGGGVFCTTLSLILSRTIEGVKSDMDDPSNSLIQLQGYCSQELVTLAITGRANSNVFDGTMVMDPKAAPGTLGAVLRGVNRSSRVGYVTLFEHYGYMTVGKHLKKPQTPVWVVCSESHYTVLWAEDWAPPAGTNVTDSFDLGYYDELGAQDEHIRLTVSPPQFGVAAGGDTGDLIPPMNHVIRTLWPDVRVSWNDTDPLL